jgi:hypothetical protein
VQLKQLEDWQGLLSKQAQQSAGKQTPRGCCGSGARRLAVQCTPPRSACCVMLILAHLRNFMKLVYMIEYYVNGIHHKPNA